MVAGAKLQGHVIGVSPSTAGQLQAGQTQRSLRLFSGHQFVGKTILVRGCTFAAYAVHYYADRHAMNVPPRIRRAKSPDDGIAIGDLADLIKLVRPRGLEPRRLVATTTSR